MAEPLRLVPAPDVLPAPARRPALYADHLLEEMVPGPPRSFSNLRWAARQLVRLAVVALAVGAIVAVLWRPH